jgi:hypothetical protein
MRAAARKIAEAFPASIEKTAINRYMAAGREAAGSPPIWACTKTLSAR